MDLNVYDGWDEPYLFISYSSQDSATVTGVLSELQENHFRFWYDSGIPSGELFAETLAERIERSAQVLVFMSENAVKSKYVLREISYAIEHDKNIIVIYLDHVKLDRKMAFLLGCIHAIHLDDMYFRQALFRSIVKDVIIQEGLPAPSPSPAAKKDARARCEARYRLLRQIGQGGIGSAYLAADRATDRFVVVKRGVKDDTYRGRLINGFFQTEYRILSLLRCPFVPQPLDFYEDDSDIFLVESYVPGTNLSELMRQSGGFSEQEVVDIGVKLLNVLSYFSDEFVRVVHKDIKPSNIILDDKGEVFVIDFGAGKVTDLVRGRRKEVFAATPGYAAPEQYDGAESLDWRADQYGVGRTLSRLLTYDSAASAPQQNMPIRYYSQHLNPVLEGVLLKMTAMSPDRRYDSIEDAREALEKCLYAPRKERVAALQASDARLDEIRRQQAAVPSGEGANQGWDSMLEKTASIAMPRSAYADYSRPIPASRRDSATSYLTIPQKFVPEDGVSVALRPNAGWNGGPLDGGTAPIRVRGNDVTGRDGEDTVPAFHPPTEYPW